MFELLWFIASLLCLSVLFHCALIRILVRCELIIVSPKGNLFYFSVENSCRSADSDSDNFFYFGNDIVPALNCAEVEKALKRLFFLKAFSNVFCFGRFHASRFDFLSTEYRLTSKRHFRGTCDYYVFLLIIFRFLLFILAMCLLSFTLPLFFKGFSTRENTQTLEVPSKVILAIIFFQHYIFLRFFLKASKSFLFWEVSRFALQLPLCVSFFETANVTSGQFVFIVLIA